MASSLLNSTMLLIFGLILAASAAPLTSRENADATDTEVKELLGLIHNENRRDGLDLSHDFPGSQNNDDASEEWRIWGRSLMQRKEWLSPEVAEMKPERVKTEIMEASEDQIDRAAKGSDKQTVGLDWGSVRPLEGHTDESTLNDQHSGTRAKRPEDVFLQDDSAKDSSQRGEESNPTSGEDSKIQSVKDQGSFTDPIAVASSSDVKQVTAEKETTVPLKEENSEEDLSQRKEEGNPTSDKDSKIELVRGQGRFTDSIAVASSTDVKQVTVEKKLADLLKEEDELQAASKLSEKLSEKDSNQRRDEDSPTSDENSKIQFVKEQGSSTNSINVASSTDVKQATAEAVLSKVENELQEASKLSENLMENPENEVKATEKKLNSESSDDNVFLLPNDDNQRKDISKAEAEGDEDPNTRTDSVVKEEGTSKTKGSSDDAVSTGDSEIENVKETENNNGMSKVAISQQSASVESYGSERNPAGNERTKELNGSPAVETNDGTKYKAKSLTQQEISVDENHIANLKKTGSVEDAALDLAKASESLDYQKENINVEGTTKDKDSENMHRSKLSSKVSNENQGSGKVFPEFDTGKDKSSKATIKSDDENLEEIEDGDKNIAKLGNTDSRLKGDATVDSKEVGEISQNSQTSKDSVLNEQASDGFFQAFEDDHKTLVRIEHFLAVFDKEMKVASDRRSTPVESAGLLDKNTPQTAADITNKKAEAFLDRSRDGAHVSDGSSAKVEASHLGKGQLVENEHAVNDLGDNLEALVKEEADSEILGKNKEPTTIRESDSDRKITDEVQNNSPVNDFEDGLAAPVKEEAVSENREIKEHTAIHGSDGYKKNTDVVENDSPVNNLEDGLEALVKEDAASGILKMKEHTAIHESDSDKKNTDEDKNISPENDPTDSLAALLKKKASSGIIEIQEPTTIHESGSDKKNTDEVEIDSPVNDFEDGLEALAKEEADSEILEIKEHTAIQESNSDKENIEYDLVAVDEVSSNTAQTKALENSEHQKEDINVETSAKDEDPGNMPGSKLATKLSNENQASEKAVQELDTEKEKSDKDVVKSADKTPEETEAGDRNTKPENSQSLSSDEDQEELTPEGDLHHSDAKSQNGLVVSKSGVNKLVQVTKNEGIKQKLTVEPQSPSHEESNAQAGGQSVPSQKENVEPTPGEFVFAKCSFQPNTFQRPQVANLNGIKGQLVFRQKTLGGATEVRGKIYGFDTSRPEEHTVDIHEFGDLCDGCKSTGGEYIVSTDKDTTGTASNLGVLNLDEMGSVKSTWTTESLGLVGEHSILGRAVVVHVKKDDQDKGSENARDTTLGCCIVARSVDVVPWV